jgi:hypothetical protein
MLAEFRLDLRLDRRPAARRFGIDIYGEAILGPRKEERLEPTLATMKKRFLDVKAADLAKSLNVQCLFVAVTHHRRANLLDHGSKVIAVGKLTPPQVRPRRSVRAHTAPNERQKRRVSSPNHGAN